MVDMTNNIIHENTVLRAGAYLATRQGIHDPIEVGKHLMKLGSDEIVTGGFWVWKVDTGVEFYSPNFRKALGFKDETDFPSEDTSWQKQIEPKSLEIAMGNVKVVMDAASKEPLTSVYCKAPYRQMVKYRKKGGGIVELFCSGTLLMYKGKPTLFVGTHKLKRRE